MNWFKKLKPFKPLKVNMYPKRSKAEVRLIDRKPFGDKDRDKVINFFDCKPLNRRKQGYMIKKKKASPFRYQDSNQEKVIHSGWQKGNVYRHVLEGTGDVFRETSKSNYIDPGYIGEKMRRIKEQIAKEKSKTIHQDDSYVTSHKENKDKFEKMEQQWKEQPTDTVLQKKAKELNLAMLKGDFEEAEKIIPEIESEVGE